MPVCSPVPGAGADKGVPWRAQSRAVRGEAVCTLASRPAANRSVLHCHRALPHSRGVQRGVKQPSTAPTPQTTCLGLSFDMGKLRHGKWMLKVGLCQKQGGSNAGKEGRWKPPRPTHDTPTIPPHVEGPWVHHTSGVGPSWGTERFGDGAGRTPSPRTPPGFPGPMGTPVQPPRSQPCPSSWRTRVAERAAALAEGRVDLQG